MKHGGDLKSDGQRILGITDWIYVGQVAMECLEQSEQSPKVSLIR